MSTIINADYNPTDINVINRDTLASNRDTVLFTRDTHIDHINKNLQFIHIPKNGGTSVEQKAIEKLNISWALIIYQDDPRLAEHLMEIVCHYYPDYCPEMAIWHVPIQIIQKSLLKSSDLWNKQIYEQYFDTTHNVDYFCFIRNPYTRIISEYGWSLFHEFTDFRASNFLSAYNWTQKFGKAYNETQCTAEALNYFLHIVLKQILNNEISKCYHNCHYLPQFEYIYDIDNNQQICKYVFHLKTFRKSIDYMFRLYNITKLNHYNIPIWNKQRKLACTFMLSPDDLDQESLHLIHQVYAKDFELLPFESRL